jgi:outer membrane protein TolC
MMQDVVFDTTQQLQVEKRIEYQLLQTNKKLQQQAVNYYRSQFLPSLSAFYSYNDQYESNPYGNFLKQAYPYSYIGGTISIPIFTGFRRTESIQRAKLQLQQLDGAEYNLKSGIYVEYSNALATYKSNFYDLTVLRENVTMSKDVYSVVTFQYKQGIVPYLNVITAESDLVSSEINYINSLFQLLLSKVDLEKALGSIQPK